MPEIEANLKSPTSRKKKNDQNRDLEGLNLYQHVTFHGELKSSNQNKLLYDYNLVHKQHTFEKSNPKIFRPRLFVETGCREHAFVSIKIL